ncbi:MAG: hypothetical protein SOR61_00250 [Evtepia sp.]|uniref:hypothetical protein n=1 Tax=Evtepia sp. TaxID=2773933 RepID=UPI002A7522D7|nr:hypothetical protein [Evtepia sp.]MDY3013638.1 hypothetical protein [Evtepia sp.]
MKFKKYVPPLVMWLVFETIALTLWLALDNIFYFFNFSYIGTAIAVGLVLYGQKKRYARNVVQFAVGLWETFFGYRYYAGCGAGAGSVGRARYCGSG